MKIASNNPRMLDPNDAYNKDTKGTPKAAEGSPKPEQKDRVEISGEANVRGYTNNRIGDAYKTNSTSQDGDSQAAPVLNVSQESSISAERLDQIRERIQSGYYDNDQVLNSVADMMVNDVKKIDNNF